jgi:hypothetical protein
MEAAANAYQRRVSAECPGILAHAPDGSGLEEAVVESVGAVAAAMNPFVSQAGDSFALGTEQLRWSSASVTRSARALAENLKAQTATLPPDLCGDLRAWVASGYRQLPMAARQFVAQFSTPHPPFPWEVLRILSRFEGPRLSAEARRVKGLEERWLALGFLLGTPAQIELLHALAVRLPSPHTP